MKLGSVLPTADIPVVLPENGHHQRAARLKLVEAVHSLNASAAAGSSNELTFSIDRNSRRPIIRIVNRETGEVIRQIPGEHVLRAAEDLKLDLCTLCL